MRLYLVNKMTDESQFDEMNFGEPVLIEAESLEDAFIELRADDDGDDEDRRCRKEWQEYGDEYIEDGKEYGTFAKYEDEYREYIMIVCLTNLVGLKGLLNV